MDADRTITIRISAQTAMLLGILLLAAALRLWCFNGLHWDDDPDYVCRAHQVLNGQQYIFRDNNGFRIGTYYPAALSYLLFGVSDISAGAYALTVSLLGVAAVFSLGKLLFGVRAGLVGALLLAVYPLDVELASRLMPDGLLAGFSLFSVYFLLRGDLRNRASRSSALQGWWCYALSGLLLGWCTLVNMSAVVIVLFVAVYLPLSLPLFWEKLRAAGLPRSLFTIWLGRCAILAAGFAVVAILEGWAYCRVTGDFLFKYHNTLSHYAESHGFCTDPGLYPRIMFHLGNDMRPRFQGLADSYYGFYYLVALVAVVLGLMRWSAHRGIVICWLLTVCCYLQWGSMSLTEYIPLHRLPRHLSLATPPMILSLAFLLGASGNRRGKLRRYAAAAVVVFLVASSLLFCRHRHQSLQDAVVCQRRIHECLDSLQPARVYAACNTIAYQRFLDRFQDCGRRYVDFRRARHCQHDNAVAIVGEFRNWKDVVREVLPDPGRIPANWELHTTLTVPGRLQRPPYQVKIYCLRNRPVREMRRLRRREAREHLRREFPEAVTPASAIILSWECDQLDGTEELVLAGETLQLRHLAFCPPDGVSYRLLTPLPASGRFRYRIVQTKGRGTVTITQGPSSQNEWTMKIIVDDGPYPAGDCYSFYLVGNPR